MTNLKVLYAKGCWRINKDEIKALVIMGIEVIV